MSAGGGVPAGTGPQMAMNYIMPRVMGNNFTPGQPFVRQAGDAMASGKGPGTTAQQSVPFGANSATQMQPTPGGIQQAGAPGASPMSAMAAPQYTATPGAASQIQSLLGGTATNPFAGAGAAPTGVGANGGLTPGMQIAKSMMSQTVEGGGAPNNTIGLLGGLGANMIGNMFGANNRSAIGDIAGALALGRPITDAQWAQAGYGPGGAALGG